MSYNAARKKGASENMTGCNPVVWAKVRLYLAILDRLRFSKGMKFTSEAANKKRRLTEKEEAKRKRLELPAGVFPLDSAPMWRQLLNWNVPKEAKIKKQGSIGNKAKPRPELLAQAVKDSVIYLLEFLELLYFVHKKSYKDCDLTFQYYGKILFNNKTSAIIQSVSSQCRDEEDRGLYNGLPRPYFYCAAVSRKAFESKTYLLYPHLLDSDSFSVTECVMKHANKLVKSDESILLSRNQIHFASIRSIFMDRSVTLLTHMWPSLVHFFNFPKDKQTYLIPLCGQGDYFEGIGHQMLIIASLSTDKLGTLCIYDPLDKKDEELNSHLNLESVRDAMIYCKVGGTEKWSISTNPYYPGPRQKGNYCITACSCLALDFAGHKEFSGFSVRKDVSFPEYAQYRKLLGEIVHDFEENEGKKDRDPSHSFFSDEELESFRLFDY
jgi:hypothetical protein